MEETENYKSMGMVSLILAIIGFFLFPLAIAGLILGYISKKHGDKNGAYGFYISIVAIIISIIVAIIATMYVYYSGMLGL